MTDHVTTAKECRALIATKLEALHFKESQEAGVYIGALTKAQLPNWIGKLARKYNVRTSSAYQVQVDVWQINCRMSDATLVHLWNNPENRKSVMGMVKLFLQSEGKTSEPGNGLSGDRKRRSGSHPAFKHHTSESLVQNIQSSQWSEHAFLPVAGQVHEKSEKQVFPYAAANNAYIPWRDVLKFLIEPSTNDPESKQLKKRDAAKVRQAFYKLKQAAEDSMPLSANVCYSLPFTKMVIFNIYDEDLRRQCMNRLLQRPSQFPQFGDIDAIS